MDGKDAAMFDLDRAPTGRDEEVGAAMTTARSMLGYSLEGAAGAMGMSTSLLEQIELGKVHISTTLRLEVQQFYEIDLDPLIVAREGWVEREPMEYNEEAGVLRVGNLGVAFRRTVDSNDDLLRGFSSAVRSERGMGVNEPLRLRAADLPLLGYLVDLEDPDLDARAQFWFGQTDETRQGFRFLLEVAHNGAENQAE